MTPSSSRVVAIVLPLIALAATLTSAHAATPSPPTRPHAD
jgi:hypothetical protein